MKSKFDLNFAQMTANAVVEVRSTIAQFHERDASIVQKLESDIQTISGLLPSIEVGIVRSQYEFVQTALKALRVRACIMRIAHDGQGDLVGERERFRVLWSDLRRAFQDLNLSLTGLGNLLAKNADDVDAVAFAQELLKFPLPTTYRWVPTDAANTLSQRACEKSSELSVLVKLAAKLDGHPFTSTQSVKPQILFALDFEILGTGWKDTYSHLSLEFVTSCPREQFSVTSFASIAIVSGGSEFTAQAKGHIQFSSPQTMSAAPLAFSLRCTMHKKDASCEDVPTIGSNQLAFRVVSAASRPTQAGYPRLAEHVAALLEELVRSQPTVESEMPELVPVLDALTDVLGSHSQDATFKGQSQVYEKDFQKVVAHDLRARLGQDVTVNAGQTGGYTDIRFRGVIVELKVERKNGDRAAICEAYKQQPTQYTSVEARQVAIALILDMTTKDLPPGDIRNDVLLVDVPTHGGADADKKYPSKAFVFVLNANQRDPSAYSR